MTCDRRIHYHGHIPQPLDLPQTVERLAVAVAMGALGRELTADEAKACIAVAHYFTAPPRAA